MCKLVPYWGLSAQPGSLNHDIFSIVNHAQNALTVCIFLMMMAWACEMIQQRKLSFIFLIAGHTKFSPDLLFSRISQTYNMSDVFNTEELKNVISLYADVIVDDGCMVCDWRNAMTKYSKLPGIRSLHDFIFTLNLVITAVIAKVRKNCGTGTFDNATIHVISGQQYAIPNQASENYTNLSV